MDLHFFKTALKYNASLTIIAVVILYLLKPIFNNIEFISNNPIIALSFFLISINALVLVLLYTKKEKNKNKPLTTSEFKNNHIIGNKAKNMKIESYENIQGNTINNNKVDGDITIKQGFKNDEK